MPLRSLSAPLLRSMAHGGARRNTVLAALIFFLLGGWICLEASQLPFGGFRMPGAGFFPLLLGVALCLLSLILLLTSLLGPAETASASPARAEVFYLMAAILAAAWLFERLGFLSTMALFLGVILKVLGKLGWTATVVLAVVGSAAASVLFNRVLLIGLPSGILPW
jgi:Tripartite tricarboxylate transporter TctB family